MKKELKQEIKIRLIGYFQDESTTDEIINITGLSRYELEEILRDIEFAGMTINEAIKKISRLIN